MFNLQSLILSFAAPHSGVPKITHSKHEIRIMQIRRLMTEAFFPTYLKNPCTRVSNYDFNPPTVYLNIHNDHESVILSATATDSFRLRTKLCAWICIPFKGKRTFLFINYILENLASLLVSMTYF